MIFDFLNALNKNLFLININSFNNIHLLKSFLTENEKKFLIFSDFEKYLTFHDFAKEINNLQVELRFGFRLNKRYSNNENQDQILLIPKNQDGIKKIYEISSEIAYVKSSIKEDNISNLIKDDNLIITNSKIDKKTCALIDKNGFLFFENWSKDLSFINIFINQKDLTINQIKTIIEFAKTANKEFLFSIDFDLLDEEINEKIKFFADEIKNSESLLLKIKNESETKISNSCIKTIAKNLNEQQKESVFTDLKPTIVIAGAGSGKTKVLTERIIYLIVEKNIDPERILAITFTSKAKDEMIKRISDAYISAPTNIKTFDSLFVQMLRNHFKNKKDEACEFLIHADEEHEEELLEISKIGHEQWFQETYPDLNKVMEKLLKNKNAKNFSEVEEEIFKLTIKNDAIIQEYIDKFDAILIDEFQDTSENQLEIVSKIAQKHKNIFVVGDPNQSIFGFRGSDPKIFEKFKEKFPHAKTFKLFQNYRSTKNILDFSNKFINEKTEFINNLTTSNPTGEAINTKACFHEGSEIKWIFNKIQEILKEDKDCSISDIAILSRTNDSLERLYKTIKNETAFKVVLWTKNKLFKSKDQNEMICWLSLIIYSDNFLIFTIFKKNSSILNINFYNEAEKISNNKKISIIELIDNKDKEMYELIKKFKNENFIEAIRILREDSQSIVDISKIKANLKNIWKTIKPFTNISDNMKMYSYHIINKYKKFQWLNENMDFSNFLLNAFTYLKSLDFEYKGEKDFINLSTIHSAKGAEFKYVFVATMNQIHKSNEEERRVYYVAFTRAKKKLFLSCDLSIGEKLDFFNKVNNYGNIKSEV